MWHGPFGARVSSSALDSFPANVEHDQTGYGVYEVGNLSNPRIGAVAVNLNWSDVEPTQGHFNWTPADKEINGWAAAGKHFALVLRYASDYAGAPCAKTYQYLPSWEAADIPTLCSTAGNLLPDYFDPRFIRDVTGYVAAAAKHIASLRHNERLLYVRIGVGVAGEGYPCINCSSLDLQRLAQWGYSVSAWASWQESMLAAFQQSVRPLGAPQLIYPLGDGDLDALTKTSVSQEVAYWAASHGMGVGQQGLQNTPGYAQGAAVRIAQRVHALHPAALIEFQTNHQITKSRVDTAEVEGDISIADSAFASFIEWYGPDTTVAEYQQYFARWQRLAGSRHGEHAPTSTA
jgi:hypothetical protein